MNRPIHFEIPAEKPERAIKFYEQVFGGEFERWNGPMEYWNISTGDSQPGINGGLMTRRDPAQACVNTMDVDSLDETIKVIEGAGGLCCAEDANARRGMAGLLQRHRGPHLWSDAG